ncbi:MAG: hypothetical protein R2789_13535 [Microthrixaceae bacterium]
MVEGDNQSVQAEKLYTELAKCGEPEPPTFTYDPDITRAAETANALVTGMIEGDHDDLPLRSGGPGVQPW